MESNMSIQKEPIVNSASNTKTQIEIEEELKKFREEHFKNNLAPQKDLGKDQHKNNVHNHLVKSTIEIDLNNNSEVISTCKKVNSCSTISASETGSDLTTSSNTKTKLAHSSEKLPEDPVGKTYLDPNQSIPNMDDDIALDHLDEDSDESDSDESEKFEKKRIARINSFRKKFADEILQGFKSFDVAGPQGTSAIKVPDIDKFHQNKEGQFGANSKYPPERGKDTLLQVDGIFDDDVLEFRTGLPQLDGYNDTNIDDANNNRNDINNNRMTFKEPFLNDDGKRKAETDDQGNDDNKLSRNENYDQVWFNKFTLGRKEMSTILKVKNVLCKQSDSTVFLVQATEWPGGRMVDNSQNANQKLKRNQPVYKIDVDQMEPEFGTDLKDELQNGKIASNLLALKVAKKKGTKKNSAQIYKEMAKELRFLRTFRNVDHHGFIIKIYAAFQTRQDLCVLTEFVPGGDLHTVASVSQVGIPETVSKFYMSEILCALGYIHKQQLVLRDLKLENVMVDLTGHVKLIDFGLAADLPGEVMLEPQRVGTRSYFPPEIDANQPYCEAVDWWCFGVTMYDLLHQEVPIKEDENGNKVYDVNNIKYADRLTKPAVDLMKKLLVVDQFKRLENAELVRFHPFFEPYSNDWRLVEDRKIRPPWIPGNKCLTNNLFPKCFDPFFTRQKLQVRPDPKFDEGEWGNGNYHYFQEFKYIGDIE